MTQQTQTKKQIVPITVDGSGSGVIQNLVVGSGIQHAFTTDTYTAFGGTDASPSPLVYALGSLTACNQVTAQLVAKDLGVTLGEFTFGVQGDLDTSVLVGGAEGNANFDAVAITASVQTDADEATFATLVSETERRCPLTQLYQRSGLDYTSTWTAVPLAAA